MSGVTALMEKPAKLSLRIIYSVCFVQFKLLSVLRPRHFLVSTGLFYCQCFLCGTFLLFFYLIGWVCVHTFVFCVLHFSFYLRVNEDITDFYTWCKYILILLGFDHCIVHSETISVSLFFYCNHC